MGMGAVLIFPPGMPVAKLRWMHRSDSMNTKESGEALHELGLLPMREIERRHIRQVLLATRGNRTKAARILGFDRKTLYRKLISFGIGSSEERT